MNCKSVRIEKCQTDGNGEKQWAVRSPSPPMGGVTKACRPTVGLHRIPRPPPPRPPPWPPCCCYHTLQHPTVGEGRDCKWLSDRLPRHAFCSPHGFCQSSPLYRGSITNVLSTHIFDHCGRVHLQIWNALLLCSSRIRPHLWMVSFVLRFSAICIGTMIEVKCKSLWQGCHTNFESWNIKTCRNSDQNLSNSSRDNLKQKQNSQIKIAKGWNDNVFSMIGPSQGGSWN